LASADTNQAALCDESPDVTGTDVKSLSHERVAQCFASMYEPRKLSQALLLSLTIFGFFFKGML